MLKAGKVIFAGSKQNAQQYAGDSTATHDLQGNTLLPDELDAVSTSHPRTTRSGVVLGSEKRISSSEALKAITINAAWQWSEENDKGTLAPGKRADLVILDKNPLKVPPATINTIKVVETIKDGKTVYKRP